MVSTTSQYLNEFTTSTINNSTETGKSPLAMLAKTCETIGLPDNSPPRKVNTSNNSSSSEYSPTGSINSSKNISKTSVSPSKDENNCNNSSNPTLMNLKPKLFSENKILSPAPTPKRTPIISQFNPMLLPQPPNHNDQMTAAALAAMTQAQFTNPIMRFPPVMTGSPFPGGMNSAMFNMPPMMPGGMIQGIPHQMDMMNLFALQAQAAVYNAQNPFMANMMHQAQQQQQQQVPNTTSATAIQAYQSLMAAATGQTEKNVCSWSDGSGICGKIFPTPDLLTQHMKSHLPDLRNSQTPTIPTSSSNSNIKKSTSASPANSIDGTLKSTKTSSRNSPIMTPILPPTNMLSSSGGLRFHPYMKNPMIRNNNHQSMKQQAVDQNVQAALNAATIQAFINSQRLMTGNTSQ